MSRAKHELPQARASPHAPEPGRYDAFVSYAREDRLAVERLRASLEAQDMLVWMDVWDIPAGTDWRARINRGIEACKAFVFLLSPASLSSEACRTELEQAIVLNKLIIPVYCRDIDENLLPQSLAEREWILLRDPDGFDAGVKELVEALKTDLGWRDEHTRLAGRTREWLDAERDASYLLRGADMRDAEHWLAHQGNHRESATAEQAEYIVASRRAATGRQRFVMSAVLGALVIAVALAIFALVQRNTARQQRNVAIHQARVATSRQLAVEATSERGHLDRSLLLAAQAVRIADTPEARAALLRAVQLSPRLVASVTDRAGPVSGLAFGPDDRVLVSAGGRGIVAWDPRRKLRMATFAPTGSSNFSGATQVRFSRDGRTLGVTQSEGPTFRWNAGSRRLLGSIDTTRYNGGSSTGTALNPDGTLLASSDHDGYRIAFWNMNTRRRSGTSLPISSRVLDPAMALVFSPDGDELLSTESSLDSVERVVVWNVKHRRRVGALELPHSPAEGSLLGLDDVHYAFDPWGRRLVTASSSGVAALWDMSTLRRIGRPFMVGRLNDLALGPDGRRLAVAGADGRIVLWDVQRRRASEAPLTGHVAGVRAVAFSRDGRMLASGGDDGRLLLWDLAGSRGLGQLMTSQRDFTGFVGYLAYSSDGRALAAAGGRASIVVWEGASSRRSVRMRGGGPIAFTADGAMLSAKGGVLVRRDIRGRQVRSLKIPVTGSAVLSPSGRRLARATDDATLEMWDVAASRRLLRTKVPDTPLTIAFGDGDTLAVGDSSGRIVVWDRDGTMLSGFRASRGSGVSGIAVSDEAGRLAAASDDEKISVWDIASRRLISHPEATSTSRGRGYAARSLAFSPDGRVLATADDLGTVILWDGSGSQPIGELRLDEQNWIRGRGGVSLAFTADGGRLAIGGEEEGQRGNIDPLFYLLPGRVVVFDTAVASWRSRACAVAHRNLTHEEWRQFVGSDRPYRQTCP